MTSVNYKIKLKQLTKEILDTGFEFDVNNISIISALKFLYNEIGEEQLPINNIHIEVGSDNELALTWRKQGNGIINIAFNDSGVATWAGYIEKPHKKEKGRFKVSDGIPDIVKNLIKETCKNVRKSK